MSPVLFDPEVSDDERRAALFAGDLFVYSPRPAASALVAFARAMLAQAFHPLDPETAQHQLPVREWARIVAALKPAFIHHPESKRLVRELLPILDDLERALEAAERHEEAALVEGVQLVQQSLRTALAKEGLAEIETEGGFDPHVHEALLTRPAEGAEAGSVLEVVQRGYRVGDRVVRPAKVIVAE